jgi:hypothetical protein
MRAGIGIALVALVATPVWAAQYPGWGDTGWGFYSKRDCCAQAIALAQQDSADRCATAGGRPRPTSGIQRGSCEWEWTTDDWGRQMYRCASESAVWCR